MNSPIANNAHGRAIGDESMQLGVLAKYMCPGKEGQRGLCVQHRCGGIHGTEALEHCHGVSVSQHNTLGVACSYEKWEEMLSKGKVK